MKKNKIIIVTAVLMIGFVSLFFIHNVVTKDSIKSPNSVYVTNITNVAYMNEGMVYDNNGLIRYIDAKSQSEIILCDKPNCIHEPWSVNNPNPTCNAAITTISTSFAIYNDKLYFVSTDEHDMTTKYVYEADVNGGNRNKIATLKNVHTIMTTSYSEDMLILGYINENLSEVLSETPKEKIHGVVMVDLRHSKVTYLPQKQGYDPILSSVHAYDGKIYYTTGFNDIMINYSDIDFSSQKDLKYIKEHSFHTLYCYNLKTSEEELLIKDNKKTVVSLFKDYAYLMNTNVSGEVVISRYHLLTNQEEVLFTEVKSSNYFIDGENIVYGLYMDQNSPVLYRYFDIENNKLIVIGSVNQSKSFTIQAIVGDKIYIMFPNEKGDYTKGCLYKNDFYRGNFDKIYKLTK